MMIIDLAASMSYTTHLVLSQAATVSTQRRVQQNAAIGCQGEEALGWVVTHQLIHYHTLRLREDQFYLRYT